MCSHVFPALAPGVWCVWLFQLISGRRTTLLLFGQRREGVTCGGRKPRRVLCADQMVVAFVDCPSKCSADSRGSPGAPLLFASKRTRRKMRIHVLRTRTLPYLGYGVRRRLRVRLALTSACSSCRCLPAVSP